jgi:hypothetical protein
VRVCPGLVAALIGVAACSGDSTIEAASPPSRLAAIEIEVRSRIGRAGCGVDAHCRALPMGARACGGPAEFVPYSSRGDDEGALLRLSAEHQRLSAEHPARRGALGPCVVLPEPAAYCDLAAPPTCRLR